MRLHVTERHVTGVNLYSDGGARWVPRSAFQRNFDRMPFATMDATYNDIVLNDSVPNRPPTGVFGVLDRAP